MTFNLLLSNLKVNQIESYEAAVADDKDESQLKRSQPNTETTRSS